MAKKLLVVVIAAIAIAVIVSLTAASGGMSIRLVAQTCLSGTGYYNMDVTLENQRDVPGTVTSFATLPNGDTIPNIFPSRIEANATVTGSFLVPNLPTGDAEVTVTIAWDDNKTSTDQNRRGISGHCPVDPSASPTPVDTNQPTATPTDTPTDSATDVPTATFTASVSPTGTVTPGQTTVPTLTATPEPSQTQAPQGTPVSEGQGQPSQIPEPTAIPTDICEDCGPAVCEIGTDDGHVTEYTSNITNQPAYLTVLTNGEEIPGGSTHVTADGTEVSFALGDTLNPLANLIASGVKVAFFNAPCSHCLVQWGNRRNPETGKLEVLFLDGGTKWDFAVATAELLGMDIHNDDHLPILKQMAERASDLYSVRPDHDINYIWVPIE